MSAGNSLLHAKQILKNIGVSKGHLVVDFGVGNAGHFSLSAARLVGETGKVFAVEILKDVLRGFEKRFAMEGHLNIVPVHGDFEALSAPLPIEPGSVDFVTSALNASCVDSFHHLAKEARRILKPEGKLLIIDWKPEVPHPVAPHASQLTDIYDAKRELMHSGFKRADEIRIGRHHWGLVLSS